MPSAAQHPASNEAIDVWLKPNARPLWLAIAALLALDIATVLGIIALWMSAPSGEPWGTPRLAGMVVLVITNGLVAFGMVGLLSLVRRPRLGYRNGKLLVTMNWSGVEEVPIEHVECIFMGETPSGLATRAEHDHPARALVVRIAERADAWRERQVDKSCGLWTDGYITIRGTWCEPLDMDLARRLNERLAAAKASLVITP